QVRRKVGAVQIDRNARLEAAVVHLRNLSCHRYQRLNNPLIPWPDRGVEMGGDDDGLPAARRAVIAGNRRR
ncbi:MAG: hypothetical protein ACEQSN_05150, partial [Yersinia sp. (in: enterobacteria)]